MYRNNDRTNVAERRAPCEVDVVDNGGGGWSPGVAGAGVFEEATGNVTCDSSDRAEFDREIARGRLDDGRAGIDKFLALIIDGRDPPRDEQNRHDSR